MRFLHNMVKTEGFTYFYRKFRRIFKWGTPPNQKPAAHPE